MKRDGKQSVSDATLQRYHDDDLSLAERRAVEAELDEDDRARLQALGELRELLGAHHALEREEVELSSTIDAIVRSAPPPIAEPPPRRGRRALLPVSVIGVLGATAACLFMFFGAGRAGVPSNEAEIESLEVEGGSATVMRMQDTSDPTQTTTVIWASLEDDEDDDANLPQGIEPADSDEKETL